GGSASRSSSGPRQRQLCAQLLQQRQRVGLVPYLGELSILEAVEALIAVVDRAVGGGNAHERAARVCTADGDSHRHETVRVDQLVQRETEVREGNDPRLEHRR